VKILFISNLYPPEIVGGAETYLERLAASLTGNGHQVSVFTTGRQDLIEEREGVSVFRFRASNIFPLIDFPKRPSWQKLVWRTGSYVFPQNLLTALNNTIARFQPDIICTQNVQGFPLALFENLRRTRLPLVHTIHDYFFLCPRLSLLHRDGNLCCIPVTEASSGRMPKSICRYYRNLLQRRTEGLYKAVVAPSRFILEAHRASGFFSGASHKVIPLGSTFPIRPAIAERKTGPLRLLSLGALSKHKGGDLLLNLPKLLKDPDFRFEIAGSGEMEEAWRDLAIHDSRVRFHGFVTGAEKERLFEEADLFLLPSIWYDNSPVVIYESFSFGLPVIASRIGGIPELIKDGENGLLIAPGDINELVAAINNLWNHPKLLNLLSRQAYVASQTYTFDLHVEEFLNILNSVKDAM